VKDPRRRLQAIGEARARIEDLLGAGAAGGASHAVPGAGAAASSGVVAAGASSARPGAIRMAPSVWAAWGVAAFAVVVSLWAVTAGPGRAGGTATSSAAVRRLEIPGISVVSSSHAAISPDGQEILSYDMTPGMPVLLSRPLDSFEVRKVPGSEGCFNPFFSPDGRSFGAFCEKGLHVLPREGGRGRLLAPVDGFASGSWGPDGTIVFSHLPASEKEPAGLMRVAATGGAPAWVVQVQRERGERAFLAPQILPDGRTVLFTKRSGGMEELMAVPLEGGTPRIVLPGASRGRYVGSGHLLYEDEATGTIRAVVFDPGALASRGTSVEVLRDIVGTNDGMLWFDVSGNGTLIYSTGGQFDADFTVVKVDRKGLATPLMDEVASWAQPRVSPDGRSLLLRRSAQPDCQFWILDMERASLSRMTFEGDFHNPVWLSGGTEVGASRLTTGDGNRRIVAMRADGGSDLRSLVAPPFPGLLEAVSPDGRWLAIVRDDRRERNDILMHDLQDGTTRPYLESDHDEDYPVFSPDGKWVAYTSNETGRNEVYVRPFPGAGARYAVSTHGGTGAMWSRDGRELFYAEGSRFMRVPVSASPRFSAGAAEPLFDNAQFVWERVRNYDILPDGQSFVMVRRAAVSARSLKVVLDWTAELQRLLPAGGTSAP
jgi:serine/threonine-protein kinase